jgi:hypothetical protein
LEGQRVGILRADDPVELLLVPLPLGPEAGVPDVEGLELPAEARGDQGPGAGRQGGFQHGDEQPLHFRFGDLPVQLETAVDQRGRVRGVPIHPLLGVEDLQPLLVPDAALGRPGRRLELPVLLREHLVGGWIPEEFGIVDDLPRDALVDDALHDPADHLLAGQPIGVAVLRLQLVAQVPVAQQLQPRRKEGLALRRHQLPGEDVVLADVIVRLHVSGGQLLVDCRRNAGHEGVAQAGHRPLLAAPAPAPRQLLGQRIVGEVEDHDAGDALLEEVLDEVGRGGVLGEQVVHRERRPQVQVEGRHQVPPHLVEVPVDALEILVEALQGFGKPLRIGDELLLAERLEIIR